jgi:EAL domain-containing protein (putative c-di-GMP-specific phosphodiesterase class I)
VTHNGSTEELATALAEGEIQAYFHPTVDLRNARVVGVEALARWEHPERGVLAPVEFLGLAEAGGQMRPLTERMIELAIRTAGDWWSSGLGLQLSVNLPTKVFTDPDWKLHKFVDRALAESGLPAEALQFEVTEDALMADPDAALETLGHLRRSGAKISVDDFGTGLFSLSRLISLPIDELKVDRSFVSNLIASDEDKTVVRTSVHLAHQMSRRVVAEGVENDETWRQLRIMGCDSAQGFMISQPMPARAVPAWLAAWNQRARELRAAPSIFRRERATVEPPAAPPAEAPA